MKTKTLGYHHHRFPPEIIGQGVQLYYRLLEQKPLQLVWNQEHEIADNSSEIRPRG